jgi:3-hydroxyisobutyrate dehydrogenase
VLYVGAAGNGNAAKLAVNTLLAIYTQGLAEAITLAKSNGIRPEDFMTLINNGALSNVYTKIKGDAILQDQYKAAFALRHMVKDLGLAQQIGLDTPLGTATAATFSEAAGRWSDDDLIAVYKHIETLRK